MNKRVSCKNRLNQLREELNIKNKDNKPKYSMMTRINITPSKKVQKRERKQLQNEKYKIANWYLNVYLKKPYSNKVYSEHLDFDDLINYCYDQVMQLRQLNTERHIMSLSELSKVEQDDTLDISSVDWKAYKIYCKEHPIFDSSDIVERRNKFTSKKYKKKKEYYKKGLMLYDPLFRDCKLNEKRMIKNLERISAENEKRCQEFHAMMERLVGNKSTDSEALKRFDDHTKSVQKQVKKHLSDLKDFETNLPFYIE